MKTINCEVITPMFSYGNNSTPELRPTELKGLMRYVYRMTQQVESKKLFQLESKRFGNTDTPSPLRLQMKKTEGSFSYEDNSITLHDRKKKTDLNSIKVGSTFEIILRLRKGHETEMQWYEEMIQLSFYLFSMGRRARRARGCVMIRFQDKTILETQTDIVRLLNKIANDGREQKEDSYQLDTTKNEIYPLQVFHEMRPLIQKISFGKTFSEEELGAFLKRVDNAGHLTKRATWSSAIDPTGSTKMASAIIVSVTKTKEGYLPIYTYVKAVYKDKKDKKGKKVEVVDSKCEERLEFQKKIEEVEQ